MSDLMSLRNIVDDPEAEPCLLDAFCEFEGLGFAKLDEIEWRMGQGMTGPAD